jgi:hypothetical protein
MALFTKIPIGILLLLSTALFGKNNLGLPIHTASDIHNNHILSDTLTGVINLCTPVLGFNCDSSLLTLGNGSVFAPGDRILIIQMQGATVNLTDSPAFGTFTDLGTSGNYEFNRVKSVSGNTLELQFSLQRKYTVEGKIQLVRVPEYENATVGAVTCAPWDGTTGGVLALEVKNVLELVDNPNVQGKGFRGGIAQDAAALAFQELHYYYPPNPVVAAAKGEGIAIIPTNQSYGRGSAGNGGGGGNAHNAGGGGGANIAAGGAGGFEFYVEPNAPTPGTNGLGGRPFTGIFPDRLIMGGGGGAGHVNDNLGTSGGNGGGIVLFKAKTIIGNGTRILANGNDVPLYANAIARDGQGGGGAGGTILVDAETQVGNFTCDVHGGMGGYCYTSIPTEFHGPGGGGSGGRVGLSAGLSNVSFDLSGGDNGFTNQINPNGAAPGIHGLFRLNSRITVDTQAFRPQPTTTKYVTFCPGTTIIINGKLYTQPDTITGIIPASKGCDTLATYILQFNYQPTLTKEIAFCKGDTVYVEGEPYTEPQTFTRTIPVFVGCDTLVTYILKYIQTSQSTKLLLDCPNPVTVDVASGVNTAVVQFDNPSSASDCSCPGIQLKRLKGLPSGGNFPLGVTEQCFEAKDSCGNKRTCCFTVNVSDGDACDVKENGCVKFELLSISQDIKFRKTYRIRVTNQCKNKLSYVAIALPPGVTAATPVQNTVYTALSGRTYNVRNPNASPFYSIRFASKSDSLAQGQSDIFQYTLPAIANPVYIQVLARIEPQIYYAAYMNVFGCDVIFAPNNAIADRQADPENALIFPNPTSGRLYADLSAWNTESVQLRIYNIHGQLLEQTTQTATNAVYALDLPSDTPKGLYWLEIISANGARVVQKFVFQ